MRELRPCPGSPNCVSTLDGLDPIPFSDPVDEAQARVRRALEESSASLRIVEEEPGYLHAEVSSRIFGFVDDLEIALDPDARVIHVRSASRKGYWDMGVNRRRVAGLADRLRQG